MTGATDPARKNLDAQGDCGANDVSAARLFATAAGLGRVSPAPAHPLPNWPRLNRSQAGVLVQNRKCLLEPPESYQDNGVSRWIIVDGTGPNGRPIILLVSSAALAAQVVANRPRPADLFPHLRRDPLAAHFEWKG